MIKLQIHGQPVQLDAEMQWHCEFATLQSALRRTYTAAYLEEHQTPIMRTPVRAAELAKITAARIGGEVTFIPEGWDIAPTPPGEVR